MKKGLIVFVALSIALLMSASMLVAQEKASAEKEKGTCKKEMKLTDEQKAKIEELRTNLRLKMIDLKAEREKLGIALKNEMAKPEPSMQEIEGIIKKLSAVREKTQLAAIGQRLEMRKLLGPDAFKGGFMWMEEGRGMKGAQGMRRGRGMHGAMMMEKPGMAGRTGMMGKPGMAAGCEMSCTGMMMQKGHGRSARPMGSWHHRMFRPFGRHERAGMAGCNTMGKGNMEGGCKMDAAGCHANEGAKKVMKCKMEREDKENPED
jgi:hypothetical protein